MELIFSASGFLVLPFRALMIFAPHWHLTRRVLQSPWAVLGPALVYSLLVIPRLAQILPQVMRPELPSIAALLATPAGATIAWLHFLAFDLFVARWVYLDAAERRLSSWLVSPLLFLTLMVGPIGLLGYLVARSPVAHVLARHLLSFARGAHRGSALLFWTSIGAGGLLAVSLGLQLVDHRIVGGVSTWLKPAKFGASVLLTGPVLAWILGQLRPASRGLRRVAAVFSATFVIELVLITIQAARGVPSHFNLLTRPDAIVFQTMGAAITVFWFGQVWLTVRAFRHRFADTTLGWGIRMGLLVATLGASLGFTMTARPTPAQIENLQAGRPTLLGGHSVGVEDGGPGLPVTRWNTTGGDLRVPHFLGLHALQLLPLAGWLLSRRRGRAAVSARLMVVLGAGFAGLLATTLIQALRGIPVLAPDAVTWAMAGGVFLFTTLAAVWAWLRSPTAGLVGVANDGFRTSAVAIRS